MTTSKPDDAQAAPGKTDFDDCSANDDVMLRRPPRLRPLFRGAGLAR